VFPVITICPTNGSGDLASRTGNSIVRGISGFGLVMVDKPRFAVEIAMPLVTCVPKRSYDNLRGYVSDL